MAFIGYKIHCILVASQLNQAAKESLDALKAQDFPDLKITLVDVSDSGAPEFEGVRVLRLGKRNRIGGGRGARGRNFSRAANLILRDLSLNIETEDSPDDFLLFLRDGVVLKPDAVSRFAEEAHTAPADLLGAKLLIGGNEEHLAGVGIEMTRMGKISMRAPYGELDQGQYDAPEEIFAVQNECFLIRRDLFVALGGFDQRIKNRLSDLDLSWRAHLAGATVMPAPQAVASFNDGRPLDRFSYPGYRFEIRMILGCYSIFSLIRLLPRVFLIAVFGFIWNLLTLSPKRSVFILDSWIWNLFNLSSIFKKRRALRRVRRKSDGTIKHLQKQNQFSPASSYREFYPNLKEITDGRRSWFIWPVIFVVLAFGSRHLFSQAVPVFGEFLDFDSHFLEDWFSSWRSGGLGADGLAPGAALWLGLWHVVFFGADSLARTAFLVAPFVLGGLGMWHLMGNIAKKPGAKALSTAAYMAVPLSYIAFRNGDLDSLIIFASAPWILSFLLAKRNFWVQCLAVSVIVGFAASFSLDAFGLLALLAFGCLAAGILVGNANFRAFFVGVLGGVGAAALNLSWGVQFWEWRPASSGDFQLLDLLIFDIGNISGGFLVWGMLGVAVLALLLSRGETGLWAVYAWVFYLGGVVLAWSGEQGWHSLANVEVLLQPAALGLSMAVGIAVDVYAQKNAQKNQREAFSWQKVLAGFAGLAFLAGAVPVLILSLDGRWDIPKSDYSSALEIIDDSSQRVLWIGHPDILGPGSYELDNGQPQDNQLGFALTLGTRPDIIQKWAYPLTDEVALISQELDNVYSLNRLGSRLALFGVSHIILLDQLSPQAERSIPLADEFKTRFEEQIDLRRINTREGISIYSNSETIPVKALLPTGSFDSAILDSSIAVPVLQESNQGQLGEGDFYFSDASNNWSLRVEGGEVQPVQIYDWASLYSQGGGAAELQYQTPLSYRILLIGQIALWLAFLLLASWAVRRSRNIKERRIL